jgi:hypothetical protein
VKIGETFREFDLAVHGDRAIRRLLALDLLGKIVGIDRQKPAHVGVLELKKARGAMRVAQVSDRFLHRTEDELEHVEEVNANVGGDAAGLALVALPGRVIPAAEVM